MSAVPAQPAVEPIAVPRALVRAATLPVLFVHGSDDPVVPAAHAREWAARLKRARLAEFPGARHDILNETVHRDVAAAVTDFVLTAA